MPRTITFQPSKELSVFIEGLVSNGSYNNQSEVVREGLRLLQEQRANSKLEQLRQLLDASDNSPLIDNWNVDEFIQGMSKQKKRVTHRIKLNANT